MIINDILSYSQFGAFSSYYQRGLLQQQMGLGTRSTSRNYVEREYNLDIRESQRSRSQRDTVRMCPIELTKQVSYWLIETKTIITGPSRVYAKYSVYMVWLLAWWFCETANSKCECLSDSLPILGILFSYQVALSSLNLSYFALHNCTLFCTVWLLSLVGLLFSEGKLRRVDLERREVGRNWEKLMEVKLQSECKVCMGNVGGGGSLNGNIERYSRNTGQMKKAYYCIC